MWIRRRMEITGRTRREMRKFYIYIQEDKKILNTIWYRKYKWMGRV